jgi:hypothetical protein
MSLLRLLTAGRSLVGLTNGASPYRMSNRRALPRFGSKANPFRATAMPSSPTSSAVPREETPGLAEPPVAAKAGPCASAAPVAAAQSGPVQRRPALRNGSGLGSARAFFAGIGTRASGGFCKCAAKVRSLVSRTPKPGKPAMLRMTPVPLQGELSLDRIKVVRNDLSESDLEVVPAKPAPAAPKPRPTGARQEPVEPAGATWGLPGAGKAAVGAGKPLS